MKGLNTVAGKGQHHTKHVSAWHYPLGVGRRLGNGSMWKEPCSTQNGKNHTLLRTKRCDSIINSEQICQHTCPKDNFNSKQRCQHTTCPRHQGNSIINSEQMSANLPRTTALLTLHQKKPIHAYNNAAPLQFTNAANKQSMKINMFPPCKS